MTWTRLWVWLWHFSWFILINHFLSCSNNKWHHSLFGGRGWFAPTRCKWHKQQHSAICHKALLWDLDSKKSLILEKTIVFIVYMNSWTVVEKLGFCSKAVSWKSGLLQHCNPQKLSWWKISHAFIFQADIAVKDWLVYFGLNIYYIMIKRQKSSSKTGTVQYTKPN